ncbi:MAG TPA: glycerophosphodiester phosphodiesterase [Candidatus Dormibacteraeota bacterium]|nr:glycerophosphodiester phosphodiesterase [Candidatus Dormibacteraeota bacterium]
MPAQRPAWIAHAGLGIRQPAGAPTAQTLHDAVRLGVDRVELDICATSDRRLLLRHDTRMPSGEPVDQLRLAELRWREPTLLTLDEGLEHLGRTPVLLDVKTASAALPLGEWLRARRDPGRFAICTELLVALLALRDLAPRVERWRSFPDIGTRRPEHVARVVGALLRHRSPAHVAYLARELGGALLDMGSSPNVGRMRVGGVPWRRLLPIRLTHLAGEVDAAALSVHHWLVTPELMDVAARLGLPVAAYTVNDAAAALRMVECGVAMVTTDDPRGMRAAVEAMPAPAAVPVEAG